MITFPKGFFLAGLLACALGLPQVSFAINGCSDRMLTGYYNVQVTNSNFLNVINAVNNAAGQAAGTTTGGMGTPGTTGGSGTATGSTGSTGTTTGSTGGTTGGGTAGSPGFFGEPTGFGTGTGATTGGTGSTGGTGAATGSTTGTTTGSAGLNPGIVNTPSSLTGAVPGVARFYLDGNGHIIGQQATAAGPGTAGLTNAVVGSYSVNDNCTATVNLSTGQTFAAVVANSGAHMIFLETDRSFGGVGGVMDRSQQACVPSTSPQSFAFSYFGALPPTTNSAAGSTTGTTTTGGTGTTTGGTDATNGAMSAFLAESTIGQLDLNGNGGFMINGWTWTNGALKPISASGSYTLNQNCSLSLTFSSPLTGATTGAYAPTSFRGLVLNPTSGTVVVESNGSTLTGHFASQ